jgi:hypothetical protein
MAPHPLPYLFKLFSLFRCQSITSLAPRVRIASPTRFAIRPGAFLRRCLRSRATSRRVVSLRLIRPSFMLSHYNQHLQAVWTATVGHDSSRSIGSHSHSA